MPALPTHPKKTGELVQTEVKDNDADNDRLCADNDQCPRDRLDEADSDNIYGAVDRWELY